MLTGTDFKKIRELIHSTCWIDLNETKRELVKARLAKRLRALRLDSYSEYVDLVMSDASGVELSTMVDMLTTNHTSFFRESDHFTYLRDEVLSGIVSGRRHRLRIWSAGCSSGEEALSIAIVCNEAIPRINAMDVSILATDISSRMIEFARRGVYSKERLDNLPAHIRAKYFKRSDKVPGDAYEAVDAVKRLVHFRKHNLAGMWPMKGPFDAVFCRNVMIYFDRDAKEALLARFFRVLSPGGVLFVGHSESLTELTDQFQYVAPGVYRRL